MHRFIWLIPLLPLAGACLNGLFGRRWRFSERVIASVAVSSVALAFALGIAAVYSYGYASHAVWPKAYVTGDDNAFAYKWISGDVGAASEAGSAIRATTFGAAARQSVATTQRNDAAIVEVVWSYQLDALSAVFMLLVTGVGLPVFIFAAGYMHGDEGFYRFFAYMGLFMFSMLLLVLASNFVMMFVGWEGVGLCSYLLIGYYFDRREAGDAARKAFVVNRIGDVGFVLAIFGLFAAFGTTQFSGVMDAARAFAPEPLGSWGVMSWLSLGLFIGAIGKSAQLPLAVWLPDAMAGPTPTSALIHAATMVTAGVYLLARANIIFQHSQTMMLSIALTGALTAVWAATIALTQNDIKKVLAYSTISQLGLMFLACGVGAFVAGVFHVVTHAFFKALLFLGAGSVIHEMYHEQDMRRMGGLRKYMPRTHRMFLVGWLAICGIVPLSGFWSKDEILWSVASTKFVPGSAVLWLAGLFVSLCTAFYMTRLVALTFWGAPKFLEVDAGGEADEAHAHAYAEGMLPHDAETQSAGDRPHHEPNEHVGAAYDKKLVADKSLAASVTRAADVSGKVHDEAPTAKRVAPQASHNGGGGAHTPHESPALMWLPLLVLAALATVGGFVGISSAVTGGAHAGNRVNIATWLEPIIWNPQTMEFGASHTQPEPGTQSLAKSGNLAALETARAISLSDSPYDKGAHTFAADIESYFGSRARAEQLLMLISLAVALSGIGVGVLFYVKLPRLPDVWARRLPPLYGVSVNRYWLDEVYGAAFTRRTIDAARLIHFLDTKIVDAAVNNCAGLTRWMSRATGIFDARVVDGIVNAIAGLTKRLLSPLTRSLQTGLTQNYALVMVLGLVLALALFFIGDIVTAVRAIFAFKF